jgi:hydroxyethylthiazole kinase-like uncharacterized protein yjeF
MHFATAQDMEHLDDLAVEHGLEIRQMMELAGFLMVPLFSELKIGKDKKIVVVCGKGNKGGDGLSAVRHLVNHGFDHVSVVLVDRDMKPDPAHHLVLLEKMQIEIVDFEKDSDLIATADVIIDALLGYHLDGAPRGLFADAIRDINQSGAHVIAYDMPSGVDATTGECFDPCVNADTTLTLAMPKKIFDTVSGKEGSGKVFVGDIGIPRFLYDMISEKSRSNFNPDGLLIIK